jgi:hypothetical protein
MATRTFDVVDGTPIPDMTLLDLPALLARKREVEGQLGAQKGSMSRAALDARDALKLENAAIDLRLRTLREADKRERARRVFAGIGSPLYEALTERLPPAVVAELASAAMEKLEARELRAAERRAASPKAPTE